MGMGNSAGTMGLGDTGAGARALGARARAEGDGHTQPGDGAGCQRSKKGAVVVGAYMLPENVLPGSMKATAPGAALQAAAMAGGPTALAGPADATSVAHAACLRMANGAMRPTATATATAPGTCLSARDAGTTVLTKAQATRGLLTGVVFDGDGNISDGSTYTTAVAALACHLEDDAPSSAEALAELDASRTRAKHRIRSLLAPPDDPLRGHGPALAHPLHVRDSDGGDSDGVVLTLADEIGEAERDRPVTSSDLIGDKPVTVADFKTDRYAPMPFSSPSLSRTLFLCLSVFLSVILLLLLLLLLILPSHVVRSSGIFGRLHIGTHYMCVVAGGCWGREPCMS